MKDHPKDDHDQKYHDEGHDAFPVWDCQHSGAPAGVSTRALRVTTFVLIADAMGGSVGRGGRGVSYLLRILLRISLPISSEYQVFEIPEDPDRDDHSESRDRERRVEPKVRPNDFHHDRRKKRADVDTHVENIVSAILEVTAFRIKIADHRRDVRFEEAVSDDEACQRGVNRP